ncbi:flagellar basal body rod protein FlgC [Salicola sp. Rm-C-2C1-2]|uniref:flagellar basal body rod protein FlgC n=1 Tax=Salicola sp. Rm-C-2C1-2 TaxID=3141321 RepID=UPI0032E3BD51
MSLNQVFDIAGSAMSAQSIRLNTTSSNLANAETASSSTGEVYRARKPVFSAIQADMMGQQGSGVSEAGFSGNELQSAGVKVDGIVESDVGLEQRYQPEHPKADDNGYVYYPNVSVVEEMADMMSASRSFQTNVEVMNTAKSMMQRVMTLGQGQ